MIHIYIYTYIHNDIYIYMGWNNKAIIIYTYIYIVFNQST